MLCWTRSPLPSPKFTPSHSQNHSKRSPRLGNFALWRRQLFLVSPLLTRGHRVDDNSGDNLLGAGPTPPVPYQLQLSTCPMMTALFRCSNLLTGDGQWGVTSPTTYRPWQLVCAYFPVLIVTRRTLIVCVCARACVCFTARK